MHVELPDGSKREVPDGATVADVAASIGKGLAKAALAGKINGKVVDVYTQVPDYAKIEIVNARVTDKAPSYVDFLYERLQRRGFLRRDCQRLINQDRNSFAASMVALGHADGMVTGVTRNYDQVLEFDGLAWRAIPVPGGVFIRELRSGTPPQWYRFGVEGSDGNVTYSLSQPLQQLDRAPPK